MRMLLNIHTRSSGFFIFILKANMFDCIICILRILSLQVNINKEDILKPSFYPILPFRLQFLI
jgi:hypothetical protein